MAKFSEVPIFVRGEDGFTVKLNQLGAVLNEVIAELTKPETITPAPAAKATGRKASTKAE